MQPSLATPLLVSCHQCAPPLRLAVRLARLRGAFEAPPSLVTRRWRSSLLSPGGAAPLRLAGERRGLARRPPGWLTSGHVGVFCLLSRNPLAVAPTRKTRPGQSGQSSEACQSAHPEVVMSANQGSSAGGSGGASPRDSTAGGSGGSSPQGSTAGGPSRRRLLKAGLAAGAIAGTGAWRSAGASAAR